VACYQDAGKRRDQASAGAQANATRALLGLLPRINAALQKAGIDADTIRKELDATPASAELARGIDILLKENPGQPDLNAVRSLPREVADPIWRTRPGGDEFRRWGSGDLVAGFRGPSQDDRSKPHR
jgi:hypothetical protein